MRRLRLWLAWSLLMLAGALVGCGKSSSPKAGDGGVSDASGSDAADGRTAADALSDGRADGGEASIALVACNGFCAGNCLGVCTGICGERTDDGDCAGRCEEICVGNCQGTCTKLARPDGGADGAVDRPTDLAVDRPVDRAVTTVDGASGETTAAIDAPPGDGGPVDAASSVDDAATPDASPYGHWTDRTRPSTLSWPPANHAGAVAFDSRRGKMVMFGGATAPGNATWEWDGADGTWQLRQQMAGQRPSRRYGHALAYDATRQKVVLYGGIDETGGSNAETWEWDGDAETWTMKARGPTPSRWGHAMAFDDESGRIVMFGGSYRHPTLGDGDLYDTWEYDGTADTWANKTYPLPPAWPRSRRGHAMAYDGVRDLVVMYGGESQAYGAALADLWEWDSHKAIWSDRTAERSTAVWPGPRVFHGLIFDGARVLLVGGAGPALWEWAADPGSWRNLTPTALPTSWPTGRTRVPIVWDSNRSTLVLTGGSLMYGNDLLADTWEWTR